MSDCITDLKFASASPRCGNICRRFEALSGDAAVMDGAAGAWKKIAAGRKAAAA
jgi:hypothetical protein